LRASRRSTARAVISLSRAIAVSILSSPEPEFYRRSETRTARVSPTMPKLES
jgi:hypothetical protein